MLGLCLCNSTSCCTDWGICYVVSGQMYRLMQMMMEPVVESQCLEVQCPEGWSQGGALVCFTVDSTITLLGSPPHQWPVRPVGAYWRPFFAGGEPAPPSISL